jgi:fused signal recognition particle receptor
MLKLFRKKIKQDENLEHSATLPISDTSAADEPQKTGFFSRLRQGLRRTRDSLSEGIATLILGRKEIDKALLDDIETQLLVADVGLDATQSLIQALTHSISRKQLSDPTELFYLLKQEMTNLLKPCEKAFAVDVKNQPTVILVVGVNGNGKTTTIGKIAKKLQQDNHSVLLAAGDTFRAAAIEQLKVWGERNEIPVIAQHQGADSASVIFDALTAAKARGIDVVLADTAGRLHTQNHLMEELKKIKRVISKFDPSAPHEVLLVLDAGTGQNALSQVKQFKMATDISGLVLTKLDGTAKGGVIFALAKEFALPIRFIGVGEGIDDLREFVAKDFVEALFDADDETIPKAFEI